MARLTFEKNLDLILSLASTIAYAFAKISGRYDLREDAASDAVLALIDVDFDPGRDGWKQYLKTRVLGRLLRDFQTRTGRRLKVPPEFVQYVDELQAVEEDPPEDRTKDEEAIAKAIELFAERDRELIYEYCDGKKQKDIAEARRLSRGRISQILTKFKRLARFFRQYGGGVAIIETNAERPTKKEEEECPLFYAKK